MNEITRKYFEEVYMTNEEDYIEACIINDCESPIEELFALAFYSNGIRDEIRLMLDAKFGEGYSVVLTKQHIVAKKYRVDFLIRIMKDGHTKSAYVVELDGHDFHEKTKAQVKRRNERDRFFASKGITVFHYSGSEVYSNPDDCVLDVLYNIEKIESRKKREENGN